jgi:hypothetical protein
MQVIYSGNGFTVSEDCPTTTDAFGFLGDCVSLFGTKKCGACGSEDIAPEHRKVQSYDFYSWKCNACQKKLRLGVTKDTHQLFAKRKADDGEWLPNGGWIKEEYQKENGQQSQQKSAPRAAAPPAPF